MILSLACPTIQQRVWDLSIVYQDEDFGAAPTCADADNTSTRLESKVNTVNTTLHKVDFASSTWPRQRLLFTMSNSNFDSKMIGIVRRYSEQVLNSMPDNPLAQSLDAVETAWQDEENKPEEWRKWLRFDRPERKVKCQ